MHPGRHAMTTRDRPGLTMAGPDVSPAYQGLDHRAKLWHGAGHRPGDQPRNGPGLPEAANARSSDRMKDTAS
jgi:hypothetical protein